MAARAGGIGSWCVGEGTAGTHWRSVVTLSRVRGFDRTRALCCAQATGAGAEAGEQPAAKAGEGQGGMLSVEGKLQMAREAVAAVSVVYLCVRPVQDTVAPQFARGPMRNTWRVRCSSSADRVCSLMQVAHLHTRPRPIAHCDIKSANFMLGADNMLKLADFGYTTHPPHGCSLGLPGTGPLSPLNSSCCA